MKRRNIEYLKRFRKPVKKSKITDILKTNFVTYLKFCMLWAFVLLLDFLIEFRLEYVWPLYLLINNIQDSFKYQGLAFSAFFVFITLTSDMICFFLIPVQWLFFTASTYAWFQYVWNSEKGVCLQTLSIWLFFVYIEVTIRLKELKSIPFHLDICRPFAAHCIGYPFITLGFGFKNYINYQMISRRKKNVNIENINCLEAIQKCLPHTDSAIKSVNKTIQSMCTKDTVNDEVLEYFKPSHNIEVANNQTSNIINGPPNLPSNKKINNSINQGIKNSSETEQKKLLNEKSNLQTIENSSNKVNKNNENEQVPNQETSTKFNLKTRESNVAIQENINKVSQSKANDKLKELKPLLSSNLNAESEEMSNILNNEPKIKPVNNGTNLQKNEVVARLELELKKTKAELNTNIQLHAELKEKLNKSQVLKNELRFQCDKLEHDNELLKGKLHNIVNARQHDKNTLSILEKKLLEERKAKSNLEQQLNHEKSLRKSRETKSFQISVKQQAIQSLCSLPSKNCNNECNENCKDKRRELEKDLIQLKKENQDKDDQLKIIDKEAKCLRQYKDSIGETEVLMNALSAMQDRNAHLESSLSAETKLKLDLFSALGETRRQLEISQVLIQQKTSEIDELKNKITELMAIMPSSGMNNAYKLIYTSKFMQKTEASSSSNDNNKVDESNDWLDLNRSSILGSNGTIYTPESVSPDL